MIEFGVRRYCQGRRGLARERGRRRSRRCATASLVRVVRRHLAGDVGQLSTEATNNVPPELGEVIGQEVRGTRRRSVAAHVVYLVVDGGVPGERHRLGARSGGARSGGTVVVAAGRWVVVRSPDEAEDVSLEVFHVHGRLKFTSFSVFPQFIPEAINN